MTDDIATLKRAGSAHLRHNAPLGADRAARLVARLRAAAPTTVVDLGCGRGALLLDVLDAMPGTTGTGVDLDAEAVAAATAASVRRGLDGRSRFVVADAGAWSGLAGAVVCVGSTHTVGGVSGVLDVAGRAGTGVVLVADGVWVAPPSAWCREQLGDHPPGLDGFTLPLRRAGWQVRYADLSTVPEWDEFEGGWCEGVRGVGTPAALAFAAEREAQYREHYRGVLGFAWAVAVRARGTRAR